MFWVFRRMYITIHSEIFKVQGGDGCLICLDGRVGLAIIEEACV